MTAQLRAIRVAPRRYQRGVNLIEIMVAMVIGLFLILGATTLYVSTKKTADVDDSIARLQETARYALSVIETDVRMANYWGIKKDGADFENKDTNLNVPAGSTASARGIGTGNYCGATYATSTEKYVEATNNGYGIPNCTAQYAASDSADTLTVRRASTSVAAASDTQIQVCSTRQTAEITKSVSETCPGGELHNLIADGYYIDTQSSVGSNVPSLRRKTLQDGPTFADTEIVPGVEDMQIELGWDNSSIDSAGVVQYYQAGAVPATGRIVSIRVWLLIRAEQPDYTFTDTRTYAYADRTGTATNTLTDDAAYAPADNYRRLLVSRTFFIRNATGT